MYRGRQKMIRNWNTSSTCFARSIGFHLDCCKWNVSTNASSFMLSCWLQTLYIFYAQSQSQPHEICFLNDESTSRWLWSFSISTISQLRKIVIKSRSSYIKSRVSNFLKMSRNMKFNFSHEQAPGHDSIFSLSTICNRFWDIEKNVPELPSTHLSLSEELNVTQQLPRIYIFY